MNRLINLSRTLPAPDPALTVAYTPIRLKMPGRQPLELRLTAPATGDALLTIRGVGHGLGGIAWLDARETEVEAPEALEATRRLILA